MEVVHRGKSGVLKVSLNPPKAMLVFEAVSLMRKKGDLAMGVRSLTNKYSFSPILSSASENLSLGNK